MTGSLIISLVIILVVEVILTISQDHIRKKVLLNMVRILILIVGAIPTIISMLLVLPSAHINVITNDDGLVGELSCRNKFCKIYYRIDNSDYREYSGPVPLAEGNTIEAYSSFFFDVFESEKVQQTISRQTAPYVQFTAKIDDSSASLSIELIRKPAIWNDLFGKNDGRIGFSAESSPTLYADGVGAMRVIFLDNNNNEIGSLKLPGDEGSCIPFISNTASYFFFGEATDDCLYIALSDINLNITLSKPGLREALRNTNNLSFKINRNNDRINIEYCTDKGPESKLPGGAVLSVDACEGETVPRITDEHGDYLVISKSLQKDKTVFFPIKTSGVIELKKIPQNISSGTLSRDEEAIQFVSSRGIYNGDESGNIRPNDVMSRISFVQALYNLDGNPLLNLPPDVPWYILAATWATEKGIILGNGSGYAWKDPLTREKCVLILWRYVGQPAPDTGSITYYDKNLISEYAYDAVLWAKQSGVIDSDWLLRPQDQITRAEAAQMIENLCLCIAIQINPIV